LLGLGGLLAAGGAVTAELWSNDVAVTPMVGLDPSLRSGSLGFVGRF
jgi:hypothetical protein